MKVDKYIMYVVWVMLNMKEEKKTVDLCIALFALIVLK